MRRRVLHGRRLQGGRLRFVQAHCRGARDAGGRRTGADHAAKKSVEEEEEEEEEGGGGGGEKGLERLAAAEGRIAGSGRRRDAVEKQWQGRNQRENLQEKLRRRRPREGCGRRRVNGNDA